MSKFYGTLRGQSKTQATRRGSKDSGIIVQAASWAGGIEVRVFERDGEERFEVAHIPWHSRGVSRVLASGKLGE